jgi:uncharacterized membrane protein (DUF373 family)
LRQPRLNRPEARNWVARGFTAAEDIVYVGLGLILTAAAVVLLGTTAVSFARSVARGSLAAGSVELLDQALLLLLMVELLYTVQVSFREHALVPEPFLLVGLIAAVRRVLVLTAAFELRNKSEVEVQHFIIELAVLTGLILALAVSLMLLRKQGAPVSAERAGLGPRNGPAPRPSGETGGAGSASAAGANGITPGPSADVTAR